MQIKCIDAKNGWNRFRVLHLDPYTHNIIYLYLYISAPMFDFVPSWRLVREIFQWNSISIFYGAWLGLDLKMDEIYNFRPFGLLVSGEDNLMKLCDNISFCKTWSGIGKRPILVNNFD